MPQRANKTVWSQRRGAYDIVCPWPLAACRMFSRKESGRADLGRRDVHEPRPAWTCDLNPIISCDAALPLHMPYHHYYYGALGCYWYYCVRPAAAMLVATVPYLSHTVTTSAQTDAGHLPCHFLNRLWAAGDRPGTTRSSVCPPPPFSLDACMPSAEACCVLSLAV